jgi:hypothetical protein
MTLLDVLDRVSSHQPQPFIAPIPDADQVEVFTLQNNIPYRFEINTRDIDPGWWFMTPATQGYKAHVSRPAHPHEYLAYLSHLPRFYVIACYRVAQSAWLVVPFNASDAAQRGWRDGSPMLMHLVREAVRPFDVIDARALSDTLLFNSVAGLEIHNIETCRQAFTGRNAISLNQDWSNAFVLLWERRKLLEIQAARKAEEERRKAAQRAIVERRLTMEDQIKFDLEFMGAELVDWSEEGEGLSVTWTYNGYTHTERLNREMRLDVPGICLGHQEDDYNWHNLSTLVATIEEGRRLHRFDIPREAWL